MRFRRALALFASAVQIWLAASDLHLDQFNGAPQPSAFGSDTNLALYHSAIAAMKRAVPNPDVVLLPGDFFAHSFPKLAKANAMTPDEAALATMRRIAGDLGRAFPRAQFAIALGNNDAPCGDYSSEHGSAYLAAVARIWAPLVDRAGAAPDFAATFARGGSYVAALPTPALRLVALDTVVYSQEYRGDCNGVANAGAVQLQWLRGVLAATPRGTRNVVLMHVPLGYDAFSTQAAHGLVAWPFLGGGGAELASLLAARQSRIAFAVAGHAHHFDVRLDDGVPMLVLGSISPVYRNDPAFYALHVDADGSLRDLDAYAFDESSGRWEPPHSFDASWHVARIDGTSLARIHGALGRDAALRSRWDAQSEAWPGDASAAWSMWGAGWRIAWCAQAVLGKGFARCAGIENRNRLGVATVWALGLGAVAALAVLVTLLFRVARRRRIVIDT